MNEQDFSADGWVARGGSQSDLRRYNERIVLGALRRRPGMFNAELARQTGLAAQTVSVIMRNLERQGLIRRGEVLRGRRGQPATPIFLDENGAFGIGCDVAPGRIVVGLCNLGGTVLGIWRHAGHDIRPDAIVDKVAEGIDAVTRSAAPATADRAARMGVHMAGMDADEIGSAGVRIIEALALRLGIDVHQISTAPALQGAIADWGAGTESGDFGHIHIGHVLGGALVLRRQSLPGPTECALDTDLMIAPEGSPAEISLAQRVSISGLSAHLDAVHSQALASGADWDWQSVESSIAPWIDDAVGALARTAIGCCAVVGCKRFIVDGAVPGGLIARLVSLTRERLGSDPRLEGMELVPGTLGDAALAVGAASVPLYRDFFALEPAE